MTRHRVLTQVAALAMASHSLFAQTSAVSVPFVGCPADGQAGPVEAPEGKNVIVNATTDAASKLAYYSSRPPAGVLAPRAWHCFGVYGSSGGVIFVTAGPIDYTIASAIFQSGLPGNAIVFDSTMGGGSGATLIAKVIARAFPKYRAFVKGVQEGYNMPASAFPSGPYPTDKLVYRTPRMVEFRTPAHALGLGTDAWLKKGDAPIDGVAILVGDTWDLLMLSVRLPRELAALAPVIIHQTELDANRPRSEPR